MNLDQIETKCFILALFVRDDGERFLLGSRMFEFVDSQLHFAANAYQNDIVEVQGNDGIMLAGQVRRSSSQAFDGYIGDSSVERATIEQNRRDFFKFFRKNHYYKVVYILPNGSAIQRRQGFIVEAPEVRELYQLFPKYHISMNFEDINYYNYEEDSEGEEIYGESATLKVATAATGGLIWEDGEETPLSGEGTNFTVNGTIDGNPLTSVELKGDTTQQTYSGKNLVNAPETFTFNRNYLNFQQFSAGTYYVSCGNVTKGGANDPQIGDSSSHIAMTSNMLNQVLNFTGTALTVYSNGWSWGDSSVDSTVEKLIITTSPISSLSEYEPYVGGVASPNPDYPQEVQVVTGDQIIDMYNKNLWGMSSITATSGSVTISGPDSTGEYSLTWGGAFTAELPSVMNLNSSSYYAISFKHKGAAISLQRVGGAVMVTTDDDSDYTTYSFVLSGETELNFELIRRGLTTGVTAYVKEFQVEIGSTATPYESHQCYEVNLGKNLLNYGQESYTFSAGVNNARLPVIGTIGLSAGTTYAISYNVDTLMTSNTRSTPYLEIGSTRYYQSESNNQNLTTGRKVWIFTPTMSGTYNFGYWSHTPDVDLTVGEFQIELGSTATSFAPYFTPIELCKIGTHQDYIYKDNGDWYIHKETGSIVYSSSDITSANSYSNIIYVMSNKPTDSDANGEYGQKEMFCTHATATNTTGTWNSTQNIGKILSGASQWTYWFGFAVGTTLAQMQTALDGCKVYYVLKTPTNTQITNADLIAQLEALLGATTYDSVTIFNVDGQLQAILSVALTAINGGGVVWDEYGATWEEGTGGGPTMIDIESIDNVYPVWELTGPAVNPQISILTTNTTLTYTGSITASQTLQVDMFNKTATLNGTSVVGNISGDWVYLKPGINRVTYTATNADAAESTIWWQEIVG